ncbi:hypothetical protein CEXT_349071 [Caerostris extrusa]|uniref:Uncharacterized protein n=1 Tax=Caerostris extrusa TaxID=172846 RepID=A0AAV4MPQ8_CAEEX|nr:hypothetical protein CEXT_349071 [Caerostris extrusa]
MESCCVGGSSLYEAVMPVKKKKKDGELLCWRLKPVRGCNASKEEEERWRAVVLEAACASKEEEKDVCVGGSSLYEAVMPVKKKKNYS